MIDVARSAQSQRMHYSNATWAPGCIRLEFDSPVFCQETGFEFH